MHDGDDTAGTQLFAELTQQGGVLTARLVGPTIGQREGPVVAGMIQARLAETQDAVRHVVLDFSQIDYINSAGLGSCVTIHTQCKAKKAVVVLHALKGELRDIFKMTRLDKIFKIADDPKRLAKILGS